jgi:FKBP-type peptidyl-prolyl cis-trans isomerase
MPRSIRPLAAFAALVLTGCSSTSGGKTTPPATPPAPAAATAANPQSALPQEVVTRDGLKYVDLKVGDGAIAETGMRAMVHYTGWLTDGTTFDSSVERGQPFSFTLGQGQVIRGWDEGVKGMRVGGKRKLTIPPDMGYGSRGAAGVIPPNATLIFDVELLDVKP